MLIFIICILIFIGIPMFCSSLGDAIGKVSGKKIFERQSKAIEEAQTRLNDIIKETEQGHPAFAAQIADLEYERDLAIARSLECKSHPAKKSAEKIREISAEKRDLKRENRILTYQLNFYEQLFPWLLEFKDEAIPEAIAAVQNTTGSDYDVVRNWLSPAEYQKLDTTERNQLALDRWKSKKKSAWEIGICFERYVGYLLEQEGYRVKYVGATMGLEDLGRDLIANKSGTTLVIQCKRWAKEKVIREKHICQLYGSVAVLASQNTDESFRGVFITSTSLSDVAKLFADYSNIAVVENLDIEEYPMVKCNVSKNGEKIYHLPFDQQYDKINIQKGKHCQYVWTVAEAEQLGFRRAYAWHPVKTQ